jgi:O-antigen/teichoic acid export membrane protein
MKKYLKNSIIYVSASIVSGVIPFLMLPVLTKYLSPEDYGVIGLIGSILGIVGIYVGLRPSLFIMVKGVQLKRLVIANYVANSIILSFGLLVVNCLILFILGSKDIIVLDQFVLVLIGVIAFFNVLIEIIETLFQIERQAFSYAIYRIFRSVVSVGLALWFIIGWKMDWHGKFYADFFSVLGFSIIALFLIWKKGFFYFKIDVKKMKELFIYLFPLTFHVFGLVLMNSIDRIFISNMISLEANGLYTVGYILAMVLMIFHDSLLKVWSPEFYDRIKGATWKTKIMIMKFIYLYMIGSIIIFILFLIVYPLVFNLIIDKKFEYAMVVIPVIALGITFESYRKLFAGFYYHRNKTGFLAITTILAGILNAGLNFLLIPEYGLMGAAYATLISYMGVFVIVISNVNRIESLPWRLK